MRNGRTQRRMVAAAGIAAFVLCAFLAHLPAQQSSVTGGTAVKDWRDTSYFDAPYRSLKKTEIFGKEITPEGRLIHVKQAKIDSYRLISERHTNELAMIIEAPQCEVDSVTHDVRSPGPLKIHSGDGRLLIEGKGFLLKDTSNNMILTISNEVFTTIKSNAVSAPSTGTNADSDRAIDIHSSYLVIDRNANLITYNRNVCASNDQFSMTCDILSIHLATNGTGVQDIVADGNVIMDSLGGGGRVTGSNAVYVATETGSLVTLTGDPHWQDGLREGTARTFYYEGTSNTFRTFRAETDAHFKLPRDSFATGSFEFMPVTLTNTAVATTNAASTNFVDLTADIVTVLLPPTNGPILGMVAERHVVILDPDSDSRATGDRATYTATNGMLELTGNSSWQSGQQIARGDVLRYDKNSGTFTAETNAFLRMPASSLGDSLSTSAPQASRGVVYTNLFLEVRSATYDFTNNVLTFHNQVKAVLLEGGVPRATLDCESLAVTVLEKTLRRILAETNVVAHQLPSQDAAGKVVEREIKCDRLDITVRTNRLLDQIAALGQCKAIQMETPTNKTLPIRLGSAADEITIFFQPDTNQVEHAVSDGHVVFIREDKILKGNRAVYTATNDTSVLSGNPSAEAPGLLSTAHDAIVYDHATGVISAYEHTRTIIQLSPEMTSSVRIMGGPKKAKK